MGKFFVIGILVIVLTVSTGLYPINVDAAGEETFDGMIDGHQHLVMSFFADVGVRYTGWFRAESYPVDFFIIYADDMGDNWTYSTDDTYENQSGIQGEFYLLIPYSGDWIICCYNPNSESQNVIIHATFYTDEDVVYFGVQILLAVVVVVGISFGGWRYRIKQKRIERQADIFN